MDQANQMMLTFRCPPELESVLPRPFPAVLGLPDWYKALPQRALNPTMGEVSQTVKKCPPFIDAMTYGFLIPLAIDLEVRDGEFSWNFEVPKGFVGEFSHSPIGFHDSSQAAGTPFFDDDQFIIKFKFLDHPGAARLLASVHPSGQSRRSAVHDAHRPRRLRHVLQHAGEFPGALARQGFQRRAA
jgi:hypothetical protein